MHGSGDPPPHASSEASQVTRGQNWRLGRQPGGSLLMVRASKEVCGLSVPPDTAEQLAPGPHAQSIRPCGEYEAMVPAGLSPGRRVREEDTGDKEGTFPSQTHHTVLRGF